LFELYPLDPDLDPEPDPVKLFLFFLLLFDEEEDPRLLFEFELVFPRLLLDP
jgi:hypothetical protein